MDNRKCIQFRHRVKRPSIDPKDCCLSSKEKNVIKSYGNEKNTQVIQTRSCVPV